MTRKTRKAFGGATARASIEGRIGRMAGRTLQVTLPAELDAEVAAAVSRGEYASAEDAVAGAVAEWGARRWRDTSLDDAELRALWREGNRERSGSEHVGRGHKA